MKYDHRYLWIYDMIIMMFNGRACFAITAFGRAVVGRARFNHKRAKFIPWPIQHMAPHLQTYTDRFIIVRRFQAIIHCVDAMRLNGMYERGQEVLLRHRMWARFPFRHFEMPMLPCGGGGGVGRVKGDVEWLSAPKEVDFRLPTWVV